MTCVNQPAKLKGRSFEIMAANPVTSLTLDDYRALYGNEHGYEYWFGEAVRKGLPTTLHGIMQGILVALFKAAGYKTASEVDLRIDPDREPRPDVLVSPVPIQRPYPTRPSALTVIEVLSPDDAMPRVFQKCRNYVRVGIKSVFIVDPEARDAWEWSLETDNTERIQAIGLPDGFTLPVSALWEELNKELA
jgi:Uma2 family endonuclease